MAIDERRRMAHLLRRAGFGTSAETLDQYLELGFEQTVETLLDPAAVDDQDLDELLEALDIDMVQNGGLQASWLIRMIHSQRPLAERIAFVWHDHFATSNQKVRNFTLMWKQYELLRDQGLGPFDELALAVAQDPAMLIWLDNVRSRKEAPNENLGREFLELFALGVGNYTENDVKAAARAFTGWSIIVAEDSQVGDGDLAGDMRRANEELSDEARVELRLRRLTVDAEFFIRDQWHDDGEKTFLGQTGRWDGSDIVRIATQEPASAEFIVGKLFDAFVWENPAANTLEPFVEVYIDSGRHIGSTIRALLMSSEFSSEQAYRAKVKSPVDLVVSLTTDILAGNLNPQILRSLPALGQVPFAPPNVGGWPNGTSWIGPGTLLERINLTWRMAGGNARTTNSLIRIQDAFAVDASMTAADIVEALVNRLLLGDIEPTQREELEAYATRSNLTGIALLETTDPAVENAFTGLVRLVTALPTYQLN